MAKKVAKKKKKTASDEPSFEAMLADLEGIVQQLEGGKLPLAESMEHYQRGVACLKGCYEQLEKAERRIEVLTGLDAEGNPITRPLDDSGHDDLTAKSKARSKRRGGASSPPSDVDDSRPLF